MCLCVCVCVCACMRVCVYVSVKTKMSAPESFLHLLTGGLNRHVFLKPGAESAVSVSDMSFQHKSNTFNVWLRYAFVESQF